MANSTKFIQTDFSCKYIKKFIFKDPIQFIKKLFLIIVGSSGSYLIPHKPSKHRLSNYRPGIKSSGCQLLFWKNSLTRILTVHYNSRWPFKVEIWSVANRVNIWSVARRPISIPLVCIFSSDWYLRFPDCVWTRQGALGWWRLLQSHQPHLALCEECHIRHLYQPKDHRKCSSHQPALPATFCHFCISIS